jgi:hypothetical protein
MQIPVEEAEFRKFQRIARAKRLTLAEWVRQTLRIASQEESLGNVDRKLGAIRRAAEHEFPAPDIETMLAEIERGYLAESTE